jgi:demethoxyubiquinone hydroxylase (CLK1/Coq7/Cat5 family)
MDMEITPLELRRLDFYRASELHGGLLLGRLVRRARDPELMLDLTRHAAEEVAHAQLWTETILAVGGRPRPPGDTYQARYARALGPVTSLFEVLALTQVFERRVYQHFIDHARLPETHSKVRATLLRMVEEEKDHLAWVKRWLDREEARGRPVRRTLRRFGRVDAVVYDELIREYRFPRSARRAATG